MEKRTGEGWCIDMKEALKLDYYYGIETEQFSFYRVPRLLIKEERFKGLSSDAKLLYGLMLDRLSLSRKNGWLDQEERAYIYYTVDTIMEDLGCAKATCSKILAELDTKKGIGLIERIRQGLGKPDRIYVKNFATFDPKNPIKGEDRTLFSKEEKTNPQVEVSEKGEKRNSFSLYEKVEEKEKQAEQQEEKQGGKQKEEKENEVCQFSEVQKLNFRKENLFHFENSEELFLETQKTDILSSKKQTSRGTEIELLEVQDLGASYNEKKKRNRSQTNSIYPIPLSFSNQKPEKEGKEQMGWMEEATAYRELIQEQIAYDYYMGLENWENRALYEELYEVICEVVCVKHKTIRIGGEIYPYEWVKAKFLKLNQQHLQYVIERMQHTTSKILNIKAYLITALYNAPNTMNHFYQQEVNYDMLGGGWKEKGIV